MGQAEKLYQRQRPRRRGRHDVTIAGGAASWILSWIVLGLSWVLDLIVDLGSWHGSGILFWNLDGVPAASKAGEPLSKSTIKLKSRASTRSCAKSPRWRRGRRDL